MVKGRSTGRTGTFSISTPKVQAIAHSKIEGAIQYIIRYKRNSQTKGILGTVCPSQIDCTSHSVVKFPGIFPNGNLLIATWEFLKIDNFLIS